ncbi:putative hemolysin [Mycoplasmoides fastidiosum]|uniref:Hemolysin n=1 Tax=Mycoplasmoides fastidiosum TaxID=92758 RepID=A0ABU0M041_9BACT|nr:CNNM domain-containing protein [Mycoplasmoides fastidiosum]MDQ0514326.1 putative hemolysin [Mycoplasmoides fastidiosum]UUD38071.1 CNNM domain-containing protein [Mycoplasmoides fastidiosum]
MSTGISIFVYVIVIILFLIGSGFVSALETSYTSISEVSWRLYLKNFEDKRLKVSIKIANLLLKKYSITVAMSLLVNNVLAVGAATFTVVWLTPMAGETVAGLISLILITILLVLFGDFVPKNLVKRHGISFVIWTSYPSFVLWIIFFPITYWFGLLFKNNNNKEEISREMIDNLTDVAYDEKVIDHHEAELVSSALELNDKVVSAFMSNNTVFGYRDNSLTDLLKIYNEYKYTRIVILQKNGEVYGTLNYKLLLDLMIDPQGQIKPETDIKIDDAITEALYLPANMKLDDALRTMQHFHNHIAVVTNNKDSKEMIGVISIEDILEELVGEIYDENDDSDDIRPINDIDWIIEQRALAVNIVKKLNLANSITFFIPPKMRAREFFIQYFKTPHLKLEQVYKNQNVSLKVSQGLDSRKYRYFVTVDEIVENHDEKMKFSLKDFWLKKQTRKITN